MPKRLKSDAPAPAVRDRALLPLVARLGVTGASRAAGISPTTTIAILRGRTHYTRARTARKVFIALHHAQSSPPISREAHKAGPCAGCGADRDQLTRGCQNCQSRHRQRRLRAEETFQRRKRARERESYLTRTR